MNKIQTIFIAIVFLITISSSVFIVDQTQQALVLQFGEIVAVKTSPGLNFKIPFIQSVIFYDNRILDINMEPLEVIAADRKRLIVNAYAKYQITDPLTYYKTVLTDEGLERRFSQVLESSLRQEIGRVELVSLISTKRVDLMDAIKKNANEKAPNYGIKIIDVRIIRTDLPQENSQAIFERMKTQHGKEAKQTRAEGAEEALKIKSMADKEKTVILADAKKQAEIIRGEGDAIAAKISSDAYNKDPDFYKFYRTMVAYRKSFSSYNTKFVLSATGDFLSMLNDFNKTKSK